jgi:hypothetical protein
MARLKNNALLERLRTQPPSVPNTDLLNDLVAGGEWRQCFKNRSTTYAYAALLINFYSVDESSLNDVDMQSRSAIKTRLAATRWLREQDLRAQSGKEIAAAMFGVALCKLILGDDVADDSVARVIVSYKPTFRPGLAPDSQGSLPPCVDAYRAIIQPHLTGWLTSRSARGLEQLAVWLGCSHTSWSDKSYVVPDLQPLAVYEPIVIESLLELLDDPAIADPLAQNYLATALDEVLVNGLLYNDRWTSCMERIDFAHAFAALLARRISRRGIPPLSELLHHSCTAPPEASAWVGAGQFLSRVTGSHHGVFEGSAYDLTEALFGDAWCSIVVRCVEESGVSGCILSNRPTFQSRLFAAAIPEAQQLPTLEHFLAPAMAGYATA